MIVIEITLACMGVGLLLVGYILRKVFAAKDRAIEYVYDAPLVKGMLTRGREHANTLKVRGLARYPGSAVLTPMGMPRPDKAPANVVF